MTEDHPLYSEWDAAYVLGALSPAERREYETHLEHCARCRAAVAELTGLPGLLGRLEPARAFELLDEPAVDAALDAPAPPPPADLVARIESRQAVRRTRRIRLIVGISAAAVVAGAIVAPVSIAVAPHHPTLTTALSQVVDSPLSADVTLTSVGWGTKVDMDCRYGDSGAGSSADASWDYALWVVQKDGTQSELSSWSAKSDSTVKLSAGTAVPVSQIAQVQVRSVDDGSVLLSSNLKTSS
ncbi:MAG TPA: zf-HC2 domain-containing protein [Pseudolysinimonas sp.]|jgi:anti-sigma factor RsiW